MSRLWKEQQEVKRENINMKIKKDQYFSAKVVKTKLCKSILNTV